MPSSRWDRPKPPHDWRWVVGTLGKVLITVGILMFGFVGYQLWGTGIEYRQAQDALAGDFDALLAGAPPTSTPPTTTTAPVDTSVPATTPPPTTAVPVPAFAPGDVMARIEIPTIGVDAYVVSGVQPADLKQGPGHYPDTPMPGQLGNSAIAGHRTTYGQPFYRLDEVAAGDEIVVTTVQGRFVYRVTGSEVVAPSQSDVIATTDPEVATLTLTTCHPRYTAAERLIVYADLDLAASSAPQAPIVQAAQPPAELAPSDASTVSTASTAATAAGPSTPTTATTTTTTAPAVLGPDEHAETGSADAFSLGWFSDPGAFAQVAVWGLALTAISIGAWLVSRRVRRNWVGALVGIVPFVVALYFFFQNVNRLLPPAL